MGSPPQVRGKRELPEGEPDRVWITPAGAGKTFTKSSRRQPCAGSPPQVRGKPNGGTGAATANRITPAGAGKTEVISIIFPLTQDHPRRCGENFMSVTKLRRSRGSPPQVRGKPTAATFNTLDKGITPAGAGKTLSGLLQSPLNGDHPRRCGENHGRDAQRVYLQGSPPQVRGKHQTCRRNT